LLKNTIEAILTIPMTDDMDLSKFTIHYVKMKSLDLKTLEENYRPTKDDVDNEYNPFHIKDIQTYNPIYSDFFVLNANNYNSISLDHKYHIVDIDHVINHKTKEMEEKPVFIKFSPLLDPIRYMIGKYDFTDSKLRLLPDLNSEEKMVKIVDKNNMSYVDNFFSFLTSRLLHKHGFVHGLDYYGSFLGIQEKFKMNIADDLEYLNTSSTFMGNIGKFFNVTEMPANEVANYGSRANKHKLDISDDDCKHNISAITIEDLSLDVETPTNIVEELESIYECNKNSKKSDSSDSSNNSETNYSTDDSDEDCDEEDEKSDSDWETEDEDESEVSSSSESESENSVYSYIHNFPIQMICLEKCDGTIDELFEKELIDEETGIAALFQIIMILATYQKVFHFTHNDLHTNNIMFVETDKEFLYYKMENRYYKVPTYGKIFKLIDFGRGIYKFSGKQYCSDSFATGGDAATQYNFEPFMNNAKPRLDPNYSFDLCRLGTSIFDFILDEDADEEELDSLQKIVNRWCLDDNGKNVLYKRNGEERYPNFKLYKMIARTVHKHRPVDQLENPAFKKFGVSSKTLTGNETIMDIDAMPCYV